MSGSSAKKLVSNSIIYSITGILQKCFSLFLMPLYTVYLTTADYGITSVAGSFSTTMGFVISLSLFSAVTRFYVELKDDPKKLSRFYGTVVLFSLLSSITWGLLLTALQKPLSAYVFSGVDYYPVIFICLVKEVFNVQHTIYTSILRSQQKALKHSVMSLLYFFLTVGLNILFVVGLKLGAVGVLLASLVVDGLFFVVFVVDMLLQKQIRFCMDLTLLKDALKYSIPIIPHNLSTQIAMLVSKVLVGAASMGTLGVFSVATQFGNIADTLQVYVNNAYAPWLYERLHDRDAGFKETIRGAVNMVCAVLGLLLIGIALYAQDFILLFLDKDYAGAWRFVPLIVLVFAVKTIYYFYINVLFYHKEASRKIFIATLSGSLINVLLSAFMIPAMGAYGSILADGIAMVIRVSIVVIMSRRYENIGLHIKDFLLNFLIVSGTIALAMAPAYFMPDGFSLLHLGYKVLITLSYGIIVYLRYKTQIKAVLSRFLKRKKKV